LDIQWNAFVELLPLWLAPNMVTLLGFFCIIANVALLVIYMPDLVGPVSISCSTALPAFWLGFGLTIVYA
jgi:hypothetical protein